MGMASEKGLVDGLARAWTGGVKIDLNQIQIQVEVVVVVVAVLRGMKAMMVIPILIVATSYPGWMNLAAHPQLLPLRRGRRPPAPAPVPVPRGD